MSDTNALVDKLNEMAVYWSGDDYDTCREAANKIEELQSKIDELMKKREPLSGELITKLWLDSVNEHDYVDTFARKIEKAQKIGVSDE